MAISDNGLYYFIVENRKKLDNCKKHHFPNSAPPYALGERVMCANCGGTMLATEANQYALGYEAAGGDPNEIIPGFR